MAAPAAGPLPRALPGRRLALIAVLAVAALAAAAVAAHLLTREHPRAIDADLERLGSSDGLYTAPQIKAQAGFSLDQTALAYGSLAALGGRPASRPSDATLARLNTRPGDDEVEQAWYGSLLAGAGVPVARLTDAERRRLWASAAATSDVELRLQRFVLMGELDPKVADHSEIVAALRATAASTDPDTERGRAELFALLGRAPDAAVRRVAAQRLPAGGDPADRVDEASAIAGSAVALRRTPPAPVRRALVDGARAANAPGTTFLAIRSLQAAGLPTGGLAPLVPSLRRSLGSRGAIGEQLVYSVVPKAVWLVAHLRRAAGEGALPEARTVKLSQILLSPEWRDDPDSYGMLMASAKLAGLSYEGAGMMPVPVPPPTVRNVRDAQVWNVRSRVAADLGNAPATVTVRPWKLSDDAEIGTVGALLHQAREVGAQARLGASLERQFLAVAPNTKYRSTRWALQAAAGLDELGRRAAADALVKRYTKVGCPGYPHLVADGDVCDLESTLFLVELRKTLPTAGRLAAGVLAQ